MLDEVAKALPEHMSPERQIRVTLTALTKTPKLMECTEASLLKCLMDLSSWGLEPDGRRAHLIPYNNRRDKTVECQLILDYKGIVELCYRSGYVTNIHADVVRQGDVFTFNLGKVEMHVPWAFRLDEKPADAGDIIAAYCYVEMKGGAIKCEVMTRGEIDAIRKRSMSGSSGPWVTDYSEMAKKTVFRRASKWLPVSAEMQDAFSRDHDSMPPIQSQPAKKVKAINLEDLTQERTDGKLFDEPAAQTTAPEDD